MQELHKVLPPDDVPPWIPDPDASRALYGVGMGRLAGWGKLGRGGQNRMPRTSSQEGTEDAMEWACLPTMRRVPGKRLGGQEEECH